MKNLALSIGALIVYSCSMSQRDHNCLTGEYYFFIEDEHDYNEIHAFQNGVMIMNWSGGYVDYTTCLTFRRAQNATSEVWLKLSGTGDTLLVWNDKEYLIKPVSSLLSLEKESSLFHEQLTYRRYLHHLKLEYESTNNDTVQLMTR